MSASAQRSKPMLLIGAVIIVMLGVVVWAVVMPQVRFARVTQRANGLVTSFLGQPKFRDVRAIAEKTNGLALIITGYVASEADLRELKTWVAAEPSPAPVAWAVLVKPATTISP